MILPKWRKRTGTIKQVEVAYYPAFIKDAQKAGAKYIKPKEKGEPGLWEFELKDEKEVRVAMLKHFGTDDADCPPDRLHSIYAIPGVTTDMKKAWMNLGKHIAKRSSPDNIIYSPDVEVIVDGFPPRGGLRFMGGYNYYALGDGSMCLLKINKIPGNVYDRLIKPGRSKVWYHDLDEAAAIVKANFSSIVEHYAVVREQLKRL